MKKILFFGFLLRILLIFISKGINNYDLNSYFLVGKAIFEKINIYPDIAKLHYPYFPFFLYFETLAYYIGKNKIIISIIIKLLNTIFDLGNIYLIYLISNKDKKKAFLYSINPISILIFSFHGQFDTLPIFFLLLSVYILKINEKLALLFLSLATMIKTWPALFLLTFYKKLKNKKNILLIFVFPFISIIFYSLFFKSNIFDILKTIVNYQGVWAVWGTSLFLKNLRLKWQKLFILIFLFIFFIYSFLNKEKNIIKEIYNLLILFIILSPSFSVQYFSWFMPFLILIKPKKCIFYIFIISFYLFFNYFSWINIYYQNFFDLITFFSWLLILLFFLLDIKKNILF